MRRTRVKICGITNVNDAQTAAACGADAIGLVFYSKSPRAINIEQAKIIIQSLPPFVSVIALFVDAKPNYIHQVINSVPIDILQLHGVSSDQECASFGKPYIKPIQVTSDTDLTLIHNKYPRAKALLLDAWHPTLAGGTGHVFDWSLIPANLDFPIILAGGLNPENVAKAIQITTPWAVDVSGGVEIEKGIKHADKIKTFIQAVAHQDTLMG